MALVARGLTLARLVGLPFFAALLVRVSADPATGERVALVVLYVVLAGSDYVDGPLARRAGATSRLWGRIDVAADVVFNFVSLAVAAALGLVGPWVPAIVAVLGARFALRMRYVAADRLPEDRAGKWAGVLFYLLVGAVVATVAVGVPSPWQLARLGDGVFLYGAVVLATGSRRGRG